MARKTLEALFQEQYPNVKKEEIQNVMPLTKRRLEIIQTMLGGLKVGSERVEEVQFSKKRIYIFLSGKGHISARRIHCPRGYEAELYCGEAHPVSKIFVNSYPKVSLE